MTAVPRIQPLGAGEFFDRYVRPSRPVIIDGLVDRAGTSGPWTLDYLRQRVGARTIPVEMPIAGHIFGDPAGSGVQHEWTTVAEFLDRVVTTSGGSARRYLAQLDLARTFPELVADLPAPACLDYVYCAKTALWVGPGEQVTPLHYDMYDNLVYMMQGRKTWTLLSPDESDLVYPRAFPAANYSEVDVERPDLTRFPAYAGATPLVVELCPGDTLFVPGGWWHHVRGHAINVSVTTMWLPPVIAAGH